MFSSVSSRKLARVALSSAVAGASVVLLLVGGPVEAAEAGGRGLKVVMDGRGL